MGIVLEIQLDVRQKTFQKRNELKIKFYKEERSGGKRNQIVISTVRCVGV